MQAVHSLQELEQLISTSEQMMVYVSRHGCSVCHALRPQIEDMLTAFPEIATVSVDADEVPDLAGAYSIFTVPVVLYFVEGKELLRRARFVPIGELTYQLERSQEMR